jgi:hypothetical protein
LWAGKFTLVTWEIWVAGSHANTSTNAATAIVQAALSMGYAHWSATGFAVPILIPAISDSMDINDEQAGMLSSGMGHQIPGSQSRSIPGNQVLFQGIFWLRSC